MYAAFCESVSQTLWRLRHAHDFPDPTELTDRVVAWRRSDVEAWLRARERGTRIVAAKPTTTLVPATLDNQRLSADVEPADVPSEARSSRRSKRRRRNSDCDDQLALPLSDRD
jgi:predicted DNA-binding transcriptional regulator AlpA